MEDEEGMLFIVLKVHMVCLDLAVRNQSDKEVSRGYIKTFRKRTQRS